MKKIILGGLAFLLLAGCHPFDPVEQAVSRYDSRAAAEAEKDLEPFVAELSAPVRAGLDEEFTLIGSLHNVTHTDYELQSRPRVFHYMIVDSTGYRINTIVMEDSAVVRKFPGETDINEFYRCKIDRPGIYEVYAIAEFAVKEDGGYRNVTYESKHRRIEIGTLS
ncbi:hypothetical protein [Paenibacillus macerans]|uniref:hypothetical protein n=1 Tax=Paenibacillus macerans TaxID=44252 RepID=UPI003D316097